MARRSAAGLLFAASLFAAVPAHAAPPSPLGIESVRSGRTPAGQAWFRVRFREAYPPAAESWWVAVTIAARRQDLRFSVRRDGPRWERRFIDRDGAPAGPAVESVADDGSLLVVLPFRAARGDRFVVQSAVAFGERVMTDSWGTPARPRRLGARVADPFLRFGPAVPALEAFRLPPRVVPPARAPALPGGSPLAAIVFGALLGAAGLVLVRPPGSLARPVVAVLLAVSVTGSLVVAGISPLPALAASSVAVAACLLLLLVAGRASPARS